jgi:D-lactate dehydrogenase
VNAHSLSLLKPKAIIVNTGRGGLIDTKAVIRSLKAGELGGLAIGYFAL